MTRSILVLLIASACTGGPGDTSDTAVVPEPLIAPCDTAARPVEPGLTPDPLAAWAALTANDHADASLVWADDSFEPGLDAWVLDWRPDPRLGPVSLQLERDGACVEQIAVWETVHATFGPYGDATEVDLSVQGAWDGTQWSWRASGFTLTTLPDELLPWWNAQMVAHLGVPPDGAPNNWRLLEIVASGRGTEGDVQVLGGMVLGAHRPVFGVGGLTLSAE